MPDPVTVEKTVAEDGREAVARLLVNDGVITDEQLVHGRRILSKMGREATVLSVLKQMGVVNDEQICQTFKSHRFELPLGAPLDRMPDLSEHPTNDSFPALPHRQLDK